MSVACKLCEKKRARRACPAASGEICPTCCGTHREVTLDCPLDCIYLREARQREILPPLDPATLPNADIRVNEKFVQEHEPVILYIALMLRTSMHTRGAVDSDAREALAGLIQSYRTLESGLIYESRPQNPYAAGLQEDLKKTIEELKNRLLQETGIHTLRDVDLLGALVFLQRMEMQYSNGRRRGRAFLDFLAAFGPGAPDVEAPESQLLKP